MKKDNNNIRYFELSSAQFSDRYGTKIKLEDITSLDRAIEIFIKNTEDYFKIYDKNRLDQFCKIKTTLHIHDTTVEDIRAGKEETYYICDHCRSTLY